MEFKLILQRNLTYLAIVGLLAWSFYNGHLEWKLSHIGHLTRIVIVAFVGVAAISFNLLLIYREFTKRKINPYLNRSVVRCKPHWLFLRFLTCRKLERLEANVLARLAEEVRACTREEQARKSEAQLSELACRFEELIQRLRNPEHWRAEWAAAASTRKKRWLLETATSSISALPIANGNRREAKIASYVPLAKTSQKADGPAVTRAVTTTSQEIKLKEVTERRLQIAHLLPPRADPVIAQLIMLELMNLGTSVSLRESNYMPGDSLRMEVRGSLRRKGLPYIPKKYFATLKCLEKLGVVKTKEKTDEDAYSLASKPSSGKTPEAAEMIRLANNLTRETRQGRLAE